MSDTPLTLCALTDLLEGALSRPPTSTSDYDLAPLARPVHADLRDAGVLVAFRPAAVAGGAELLLTKRASGLRHHPGQIAMPGGKVDPGDDGPTGAALREAHEEIGLPRGHVTVLGTLPAHQTVTGFRMTPVLGVLTAQFAPRPQPGEVDELFAVPLAHVGTSANYRIEQRLWRGIPRAYRVCPYGPYYIWGATARILHALALRLS